MKRYFVLIILLSLYSCSPVRVKYIKEPVFIKCKVPSIPKAIECRPSDNATYPQKLKCILNNYLKLKKENEMLRRSIETCK